MFDGGVVSVDTYGSMATTHAPATISVKTVHVQADGTFELKAYSHLNTWVVDATTILVNKFGLLNLSFMNIHARLHPL